MKQAIKQWIPPVILDKLHSLYFYKTYFKYRTLLKKNINLKNTGKGKRCFLLGSGPSIKKEDLRPLKNEVVFALNNFYVHDDFIEIMSGNSPKFYIVAPIHPPQTEEEWMKWFSEMERHMPENTSLIFGLNNYLRNTKFILDKYGLFKNHKINWYLSGKKFNVNRFESLGLDLTKTVYIGEAVSIYALMVAMYMGFDEIYLLGMDHDYFLYENESEMRMYQSAIHQNNELSRTFGNQFYIHEYLRQYNIFSKYKVFNDNTKSKIYNASNGGVLRVFPKVLFNTLFK